MRNIVWCVPIVALLLCAPEAWPATPEQACAAGRRKLAAKYDTCREKAYAKLLVQGDSLTYQGNLGACFARFLARWQKLEEKAAGTGAFCEVRFVDNGDGTVTDHATGLQWEQKTNDATVHDKDDLYTWSTMGGPFTPADGTAFSGFLTAVNAGCFGGHCDWRLPTLAELQTIRLALDPCGDPCIDPIFGPTVAGSYWTSTRQLGSSIGWTVRFESPTSFPGAVVPLGVTSSASTRAVRTLDPLTP